ncbi:hypothetical protein D3C72_1394520 [compost metagenome]
MEYQCLLGENGILNKANLAKNENDKAAQDEDNRLGKYNEYMDNYITSRATTGDDVSQLKEMLKTFFISSSDTKIINNINIVNSAWTNIWQYTASEDEYLNFNGWLAYTTNTTGARFLSINVGATKIFNQSNPACTANTSNNAFNLNIAVKSGETITVEVFQNSGTTLAATTNFYLKKFNL